VQYGLVIQIRFSAAANAVAWSNGVGAIEKECDAAGLEIVGYYHSHPDHASYASIRDTEQAWPDYSYLIVSCMGGEVKEGKAFYRTSWDIREMVEEPVEVVPR